MKPTLTHLCCLIVGAIAALIGFRAVQPEVVTVSEYVKAESRIKYNSDGTLAEAYFSFPTFEEYYEAVSKESGFTIIASELPKMSNSHSHKVSDWHSVMKFAPVGYESIQIDEKTYRIQKK